VEDDLEEQVSQLLLQMRVGVRVDGRVGLARAPGQRVQRVQHS